MPIEVLFKANNREVSMGEIAPGAAGSFSDFSEEPPMVISAICAAAPERKGAVFHLPGNVQSKSKYTVIDSKEYSDDRVAKELAPEDDTYEREIVNKRGQRVTLILKLI